ncbi:MAG: hypothetical protein DI537_19180 [Stutzerimonas stutzeri]|nr:MAG: hypothetical protein DI537_19180 [Stutzerimonas stutzeri]
MALKFIAQTSTIRFVGGEISVRGLSVPDLSILVQTHRDTAKELYERFTGIRKEDAITIEHAGTIASELITTAPAIVAHVIALAADVPDQFEEVVHLPIDVQAKALEDIARLTFAMEGGATGFLETLTRLAASTTRLVDEGKKPRN